MGDLRASYTKSMPERSDETRDSESSAIEAGHAPPSRLARTSGMTRRELLGLGAGAALLAACSRKAPSETESALPASKAGAPQARASSRPLAPKVAGRMPALFLAHGSPMLLDDVTWKSELRSWGKSLGKPKALLFVSAHWTRSPVRLGATQPVPLVYDFSGFPERYYEVQYPAPTAEPVAARVRELLAAQGQKTENTERGLDHGVWVPLTAMYPEADVPVLQISMPSLGPESLFALGERLAPLRDEGVVIVGSGFLTHNLRTIDPSPGAAVPSWASELDAFCKEALMRRDVDALLDYRTRAPGVAEALPTHEHFVPLFVALGAAQNEAATFPIEGFTYGSFTKRSVELGVRV